MTTPRVTVPVEPTPEMIEAVKHHWPLGYTENAKREDTVNLYRAMLSAAPAPEGGAVWFGVTGAADETEALAVALFDARCPGVRMTDEDLHYYRSAAKRAMRAVEDELDTPALATREEAPAEAGERECGWCDGRKTKQTPSTDFTIPCPYCKGTGKEALRVQPQAREDAQPVRCPRCYRGEVFGLSMDDGFWVEFSSASGGAHPAGMHGWLELAEHHPDGRMVVREYVAKDSPIYPAHDALREALQSVQRMAGNSSFNINQNGVTLETGDLMRVFDDIERTALAALQAEQGAK